MEDLSMSENITVVDRYFAFWNEADPERREELALRVFADDLSYVGPQITAEGPGGVIKVARQFAEHLPGIHFRRIGEIDAHHNRLRYAWEILRPDGETRFAAGTDIAEVAEDGRMQAITVFLDQAPSFADAPHHE
jgi:hypothetical protein